MYRSGDLRCTAWLRAIAYDAADIGQCVGNRSSDMLVVTTCHKCNGSSRAAGCTYSATKCGKCADIVLDIDRNQVTNEHRPIHLFLGNMPLTCIHENRHRHRDALISGTGIDHNRERTPTHTCIRTCRCRCTGFGTDIITPVFEDRLTDLCAPCVIETFL